MMRSHAYWLAAVLWMAACGDDDRRGPRPDAGSNDAGPPDGGGADGGHDAGPCLPAGVPCGPGSGTDLPCCSGDLGCTPLDETRFFCA